MTEKFVRRIITIKEPIESRYVINHKVKALCSDSYMPGALLLEKELPIETEIYFKGGKRFDRIKKTKIKQAKIMSITFDMVVKK